MGRVVAYTICPDPGVGYYSINVLVFHSSALGNRDRPTLDIGHAEPHGGTGPIRDIFRR